MWSFLKSSQRRKSTAGMAYDELALAGALVSSVAAFGMVAMPWDNFFMSSSQQVIQHLQDVETANLAFYDRYRLWPHQVTNGGPTANAAVLVDQTAMKFPYNTMRTYERLLPRDSFVQLEERTVSHTFGDGGMVEQMVVRGDDGRQYIEIRMTNVPLSAARAVDTEYDGSYDPAKGRVQIQFEDGIVSTDKVTLKYRANRIG